MFFPQQNGSPSIKPDKVSAPSRRFSFAAVLFALIAVYGITALTASFEPQQADVSDPKTISRDQTGQNRSNKIVVDENTKSSKKDDVKKTEGMQEIQSQVFANTDKVQPSQKPSHEQHFQRSKSVNYLGYAVKIILITALMLAAFWGVAKWMKNKRGLGGHSALPMEILGRQYLGPKQSITAVKVGDRSMLLGVTESSVQMLTELDEDNSNSTEKNPQTDDKSGQYFSDLIQRFTRNTDQNEISQVQG